jgi:hypothetical protein
LAGACFFNELGDKRQSRRELREHGDELLDRDLFENGRREMRGEFLRVGWRGAPALASVRDQSQAVCRPA